MSKKKQSNPDEQEVLEQIGEEIEQELKAEAAEDANPEIEPNVPICFDATTRTEAQAKVRELKMKAASIGLCNMVSTPILFIKKDYLDEGHFSVKLTFTK
jgi:hypothetical protein